VFRTEKQQQPLRRRFWALQAVFVWLGYWDIDELSCIGMRRVKRMIRMRLTTWRYRQEVYSKGKLLCVECPVGLLWSIGVNACLCGWAVLITVWPSVSTRRWRLSAVKMLPVSTRRTSTNCQWGYCQHLAVLPVSSITTRGAFSPRFLYDWQNFHLLLAL